MGLEASDVADVFGGQGGEGWCWGVGFVLVDWRGECIDRTVWLRLVDFGWGLRWRVYLAGHGSRD